MSVFGVYSPLHRDYSYLRLYPALFSISPSELERAQVQPKLRFDTSNYEQI